MAYNPTTGIIDGTTAVGIGDIQQCLGCGSGDIGTLSMRPNINMWSNIKPVYNSKVGELSDTDRATARVITGFKTGGGIKKWEGTYAQYKADMDSQGNPGSQLWEYDKPLNDGVCAFRISDFKGYYHFVQNVLTIYDYLDNLDGIPIPSTDVQASQGKIIDFKLYTRIVDGCIRPKVMFGDVANYYPCIVMTYGSSGSFHYAKTTDARISDLWDSTDADGNLDATIHINTAEFASAIASDYRSAYPSVSDPYAVAPLKTGSYWTICMVLSSRKLTGASGASYHNFASGDKIVRLEYSANIDRWTEQLKQSKFTVISSMSMNIRFARESTKKNGHWVYRIAFVDVTAQKTTSESITFQLGGMFQCQIGNVSIPNGGEEYDGHPLEVNLGSVTFTGSGAKTQTIYPNVYYEVTSETAGNQLLNGSLTFYHATIGTFKGGWSVNAYDFSTEYVVTNLNII